MRSAAVLLSCLFCAASAWAQYKYVDQGGTINYSDRPPASGDAKRLNMTATGNGSETLPFGLKASMDKYPVTTYSSPDCPPCEDLRKHLAKRGVPFTDKLVKTPADEKIFKSLGFANPDFPTMTVGSQKQVGYEPGALDRLLDAAGYPRKSQLPNTFTQAPASALSGEPAMVSERIARTERVLIPKTSAPPQSAPGALDDAPSGKIRF